MEAETITALMALYDNYEDNVQVPEVVTEEEEVENNAFLDAVVKTAVMQQAHAFLANKGTIIDIPITYHLLTLCWAGIKVLPTRK